MSESHTAQPAPLKPGPCTVGRLPLPSHVLVWADDCWRRAWLIGRSHEDVGWMGLVQYDDHRGNEVTRQMPAELIAAADCRPRDD
ncbi:hypothetical protein EV137_2748 [Kribbella pratensis]|uniref:Uncharacterized protein n=1 Tax=Kribbella pratensis TaxID=2512112 RepID=A0ABY2FR42_9ACTN|nr:hypothetical protein EV137_2748 [Kribbella pratensis]